MPKSIKKIEDLSFDSKNINKGSEFGTSLLHKSLTETGAGRSVLADKNGVLVAGNKTVEAAMQVGISKIKVVQTTGDELVIVQRTDIDINTPEGAKLKILDNTVSRVNYVEDAEVAEAICEEYDLRPSELGLQTAVIAPEVKEDDYEIPDEIKTDIVLGDLFEIGEHRLLCGDSTNADDVQKLLQGKEPYLMVTDPPYGVEYDPSWRDEAAKYSPSMGNRKDTAKGKVSNDDKIDWKEAWSLSPAKVAYVWHAGKYCGQVSDSLTNCDFEIRSQIIWVKSHLVIGRGDYHWKHEPCWYAVKKGSKGNWASDRKQTTVWEIDKPQKNETGHSTQKPVECMAKPIGNHDGDVHDPFLGSGTTMVAAHQLKRKCYGMELDPKYCQVILDRMKKLDPDLEIKRNGKPYG